MKLAYTNPHLGQRARLPRTVRPPDLDPTELREWMLALSRVLQQLERIGADEAVSLRALWHKMKLKTGDYEGR